MKMNYFYITVLFSILANIASSPIINSRQCPHFKTVPNFDVKSVIIFEFVSLILLHFE